MSLRATITGRAPGAPIVLLSAGMGGLKGFWRPQMAALEANCRVITYDQLGTGDNPVELPAGYSVGDMTDEIIELLDAHGLESVFFIGHAFGGLVGMDLALRHPNRLAGLVPVNAWASLSRQTARCFAARLAVLAQDGAEGYLRAQPIFLYPAAWIEDHEDEIAQETTNGLAHFQGAANLFTRIAALRDFDISKRLAEIRTPTLIVGATDDVLVPVQCARHLAANLPNATLFETTGGHSCTVTNAGAFNDAVLDFIMDIGRP